ncbi:Glutathione biosynthesis bifunctional protein GshAB [Lentilactobacillus parabuchneri]|jgi:glutamate--cysteine ligase|uniref:Glutamate--cysteine ligase n=3 Tax=Lentilactobacillus parabuchneri TaxID=152331 RepID=A0A1X1FHT2_9LACO|nr:gamma-glutamylcysteine synthetase [Lentilactobacillus parabuchneri]APR06488.1 Glutathione biosynthesis bifunctional protein GshAB [Lentilactobacillus parabuchneri]KRM46413.1 glutathione synthase [Lentilactobacillus parabuchneri DSM 5707 = NBRC 107865]KRN71388.1 glutathione synthase [Lentilactobacillus parabuchneri]MBW0223641.1 gamma-glutamylcysteine synthetase [Lentilactobacillus parabuchneri]MBW0246385.1 gamma-glutamylcysteine synthetase [Lentilactobacillus parabuchneri]
MLKNLLKYIQEEHVAEQLYHSLIGIEIEEHRIDQHGQLSQLPYPKHLGSRRYHPYFQSDFSESMSELITDPNPNIGGVLDQLDTLQTVLARSIHKSEAFWPLSMPPAMNIDDKTFIKQHFGRPAYADYRDYLTKKYGVARKIITGVHVNFSIPEPVINRLYMHYQDQFTTLVDFKNALYFQLAQNFVLHRWLLTYLFGASPIAEKGFFSDEDAQKLPHPVRSIRNSIYGYVNEPEDQVDATIYSSLDHYIDQITASIADHRLYSTAEFYGPVRLRGQEEIKNYRTKGISYLEFRVLDNTPFTPNGISRHAMYFLKFFLMYLLVTPVDHDNITDDLKQSFADNNQVALENPDQPTFKMKEGIEIFNQLIEMAKSLHAHSEQLQALDDFSEVITHPELTASAMLLPHIKNGSLMEFGTRVAKQWRQKRLEAPTLLPAMGNTSYDAQELIFHAIQLGIRYYVVKDEDGASLITLTYDNVTQVIYTDKVGKVEPLKYLYDLFPGIKKAARQDQH